LTLPLEDVVDVPQAWKLLVRMELFVFLPDRTIAGVILIGILFQRVADFDNT
jgi:hypothetical protein